MSDLVQELMGKVCRCGGPKISGHTFCRGCYVALPQAMRIALYRRVGSGYEEAYAAAVRELRGDDPRERV